MEELRRKFAEKIYYMACKLAEHDLEELDNGDDLDAYLLEQQILGICEAVFKEMIFVTLPTDTDGVMSEVSKELPSELQKRVKE